MENFLLFSVLMCIFGAFIETDAKIVLLMDEEFKDCTKGGAKYVDYTGLEYIYENDTSYFLNGKDRFSIRSPICSVSSTQAR